jgi:hypothetical protein
MRTVTVQPSDEMMKALQEERVNRKTKNIPETIISILTEYLKITKNQMIKPLRQNKKAFWRRILQYRYIRYLVFTICAFLTLIAIVNVSNCEWTGLNLLNSVYNKVNTPTDYNFVQTYPPSVGNEIRLWNLTYFQVTIHSDKMITENTPITIEAEGSESLSFAENVSSIYVGFFGANYTPDQQTTFQNNNGPIFNMWFGFAGVQLPTNGTVDDYLPFNCGNYLGFSNTTIYFSSAGDKPLSIAIDWTNNNIPAYTYTYDFSTIHVYSANDIANERYTYAGAVGGVAFLIFAIVEFAPKVGKTEEE